MRIVAKSNGRRYVFRTFDDYTGWARTVAYHSVYTLRLVRGGAYPREEQ